MNEREILACQVASKKWACPVKSCSSILSRRQTLENHLSNLHHISIGRVVKQYRQYENDISVPVPKTTQWRKTSKLKSVFCGPRDYLMMLNPDPGDVNDVLPSSDSGQVKNGLATNSCQANNALSSRSDQKTGVLDTSSDQETDVLDTSSDQETDVHNTNSDQETDVHYTNSHQETDVHNTNSDQETDVPNTNSDQETDVHNTNSHQETDVPNTNSDQENNIFTGTNHLVDNGLSSDDNLNNAHSCCKLDDTCYTEQDMDIDYDSVVNAVSLKESQVIHGDQTKSTVNIPVDSPLYVLPPSLTGYSSQITTNEHIILASAFASRYSLPDGGIQDLLRMLQRYVPAHNTAETSVYELKKKCGFDVNYLNFHLYCDACKKLFSVEENICQTPGCNGLKTDPDNRKYFVTSDLKLQLQEVLQRKDIWEMILSSKAEVFDSDKPLCDIRSGSGYQELQRPGCFLRNTNNLTLSMFVDGVSLFRSSGIQIWPVYLLVNELPAKERYTRKNMLLWGVWQGKGKPLMNMFLKPLILDLLELYNDGVTVLINNQPTTVKAMLILATMDLQARAYVTNMTQHNGQYGCLYCEEPGVVVASGSGSCRAYPVRDRKPTQRTDANIKENAKLAQADGKRHVGILGVSVFQYLPYFSLTKNVVVDYMHGTLLGITKKLLFLWFDNVNKTTEHYIGGHMTKIDHLMQKISPPYLIHRLPRVLTNTYHHWKASELRNWLLFYSVPCLQGKLKDIYLKHYCCLVEAIYILLSEGIVPSQLDRAETLIQFFMLNAPLLYGENFQSLNLHNLWHMIDCVKLWGPLWCWSCFPFESFNGEIKKNIHGTGNVCRQIFWIFQAQKRVMQLESDLAEGEVKELVQSMFEGRGQRSIGVDAYQCRTIKSVPVQSELEHFVKVQLKILIGDSDESLFLSVAKVVRNGFYFYSTKCMKVKKQNSYTIALETSTGDGEVALEVEYFLQHKKSKRVFAIGKLMKAGESSMDGYVSHQRRLEYSNRVVLRCEQLREPMMIVKIEDKIYGSLFPNHFERD